MQKKIIISIITLLIIIIAVIVKIQYFPFGYGVEKLDENETRLGKHLVSENIPNTSIYSYRLDMKIRNKNEFVNFLKSSAESFEEGKYMDSTRYELGSFTDTDGEVDWQHVFESTKTYRLVWKTVYSLEYKTSDPGCNGYRLDVTSDGYIRDYRSAGK